MECSMRVLFWFCDRFAWTTSMKALANAPEGEPGEYQNSVVAFVHVEPKDGEQGSSAETKLVKNAKWLARKWNVTNIILHSFTHLGEEKADADAACALLDRVERRLQDAGYRTAQTPYGYFLNLEITARGHPLARVYKEF
jgi:hypothetical protein